MDRARIAEWILSLVLSPQRAASAVGDWMEDAAERGDIWFWSCVLRTGISGVWDDFVESPGFMVGLAFRGVLYSLYLLVVSLAVIIPIAFIVFGVVFLVTAVVGPLLPAHPALTHLEETSDMVAALMGFVWIAACNFATGRWIARHAPGREMAAGIAACVVPWVFLSLLGFVVDHYWSSEIIRFFARHPVDTGHSSPSPNIVANFPWEIFLIAGALWVRRKSARSVAQ